MNDRDMVDCAIAAGVKRLPHFERYADRIAELFETGQIPRTANPAQDLLDAYHCVAAADAVAGGEAR